MQWEYCERRIWEIISNKIDIYDNPAWETILDTDVVDDIVEFVHEEVQRLG